MWFDTHVNLHHERFDKDRADVVARARESGVSDMVEICQNADDSDRVLGIAREHDLWATVGTHPHYAKDAGNLTVERLVEVAKDDRVVGIGETGLDFHYGYSGKASQRSNFAKHIEAAQQTQLPLVIHSREADAAMAETLTQAQSLMAFPMLLHCFTATPALAETVLELGGYVSFSGIVTFKKADDVREAVGLVPDDRIIVETDCPYLTPVPDRGQRCEPRHVVNVGETVARLRDVSAAACAEMTTRNAYALFAKAKR